MLAEIKVMQKLKGCANIASIEDSALVERQEGLGYDMFQLNLTFCPKKSLHLT